MTINNFPPYRLTGYIFLLVNFFCREEGKTVSNYDNKQLPDLPPHRLYIPLGQFFLPERREDGKQL